MFDYQDGCNQDPLEAIEMMRMNFSQHATKRLQLAGYYSTNQSGSENILDMLTSSLKYEIIPPSRFISGNLEKNNLINQVKSQSSNGFSSADHQSGNINNHEHNINKSPLKQPSVDPLVDLNCWQRPKIGSFARLSCVNNKKSQVKLIGANLLECRPRGWTPVRSSITNIGMPTVARKQQADQKRRLSSSLAAAASGRRPTRAERPDGQELTPVSSSPNRVEGESITGPYNEKRPEEDDDDNSDDSAAEVLTDRHGGVESSSEQEGKAVNSFPSANQDGQEEKIRFENEVQSSDYDQLSFNELAALLPACVSLAPANKPKIRPNSNRLPLIEASSASIDNNGKLLTKHGKSRNDDFNWYFFSRSSSESNNRLCFIERSLMVVFCLISLLILGCYRSQDLVVTAKR